MYSIAVAISTHNRYSTFKKCYDWVKIMLPPNAKLFVIDDASDFPVPEATFRFEQRVGIAQTKNMCLQLCEGADHIFCFDDDIHPRASNWWKPYVESGLNHACYTFGRTELKKIEGYYTSYELPCGLMLYFRKICLEKIGGFDPNFGLWGYEHVSLSDRIYNAGLTPARYIDVPNSKDLFYSYDEHSKIESSVNSIERISCISKNNELRKQTINSKQFIPYK